MLTMLISFNNSKLKKSNSQMLRSMNPSGKKQSFAGIPYVMLAIILYLFTETGSNEDIAGSSQDDDGESLPASGMANVMAKILCKRVNSSKSVILAKCKTDRELTFGKRAEKSSDTIEVEPVKELQTAKVQRDLIIKVRVNSLFGFGYLHCVSKKRAKFDKL